MASPGEDDGESVLSDLDGDEAAPAPEGRLRELLVELERERRGREAAESSRLELQSSFNRLKALAHEAIGKRDEAARRLEEATLELAEAIRVKEEALKERDETARRLEEASRARDGLRSEMENAAHLLVTGIEKVSAKASNFKNFSGLGLPRSKKCTGLPAVAYGVIERTNEIFEELVKQIDSVSKSRDELRQQMDQRSYEIANEVSQLESSISDLRDEVEKKNLVIERFEKVSLVGSEASELRLKDLVIDQLSYVSKIHDQIYKVIKMVDSNDLDQSEFSESLFFPREMDMEENVRACVAGMESIYDLIRIVSGKTRDLVENKGQEVKYLNETVAKLVKEKEQIGSLLRGALSKRSEVFHVTENGLREAGFGFKLNKLLVDGKASASPDKEDSLEREDEIYNLAGALENIAKTSQLEIIDLQHSVDELRAESNSLKEHVEAQARELYHRKQRIEELEEKERVANESVEGLMMDIAAAEEEIARWKVAAEEEAASGRAVEKELLPQLTAFGQELEEAKRAMVELEKKLRFKEEISTAAMAARDAAEKSLRLADIRATRLRDRLEELSRQLEALESREDLMSRSGRPRYACWPWQWLGIDYARACQPDARERQVSNGTELSEPLL